MIAETLITRLKRLDTCAASDALDRFGLNGVVLGINSLTTIQRIAGRVATLKLKILKDEISEHHLGASVIDQALPGDIVAIEHGGRTDVAGWGGILSTAATVKGISGVIIDGACRDVDEARELSFPIYARAAVPVTARRRITEESFNQPIKIAGIKVSPGDFVIADSSGVVFIPLDRAEEIISFAEDIVLRESEMIREVLLARPVVEVLTGSYESMLSREETP
jgi:4-hydroxy-4-methyl-2-oxoglutarate aldolase